MRIQDNGGGFDTRSIQAGHFGLGIMKERAAGIGALVEVSSEIGKGTEVRVSWVSETEESDRA
jgi:two-component system nitrate/nitrite sensor histidine kinase NarX